MSPKEKLQKLASDIMKKLKCPVCQEIRENVNLLRCGHVLCEMCLETMQRHKIEEARRRQPDGADNHEDIFIHCPVCKSPKQVDTQSYKIYILSQLLNVLNQCSNINDIMPILSCPVCREIMKNGKSLYCGHVLCETCLETIRRLQIEETLGEQANDWWNAAYVDVHENIDIPCPVCKAKNRDGAQSNRICILAQIYDILKPYIDRNEGENYIIPNAIAGVGNQDVQHQNGIPVNMESNEGSDIEFEEDDWSLIDNEQGHEETLDQNSPLDNAEINTNAEGPGGNPFRSRRSNEDIAVDRIHSFLERTQLPTRHRNLPF